MTLPREHPEDHAAPAPDTSADARRAASSDSSLRFWRSLDELAATPEFKQHLENEFPHGPNDPHSKFDRREILKVMAASAAFAGLTGCTKLPTQKILPYVRQPEEIVPGKPLFYATAMTLGGIANGLLAESNMARPTKIEGNPDHPASLGATDVFAQAAVLSLYDPDRSRTVIHDGRIASWNEFERQALVALEEQRAKRGAGMRILTESISSPSLGAQMQALLSQFPQARWHQYESVSRDAAREGAQQAFGEYLNAVYRLDRAQVILALDADFLCSGPGCLRYARDFARGRREPDSAGGMNRLYVVESSPSNTGSMADHRLRLRAVEIEAFARALAQQLGLTIGAGQPLASPQAAAWMTPLPPDFQPHAGASLIIAGDRQPPVVHAICHAFNQRLENFDKTVYLTAPLEVSPVNQWQSIGALASDLHSGSVDLLVIIGGNPAYDAPADLAFSSLLPSVKFSARLGLYEDETSALCHWHIPQTHFLEQWGDARAFDGTVSLIQPLIAPLYEGLSAHEVLALLNGEPAKSGHDIVRDFWKTQQAPGEKGTVGKSTAAQAPPKSQSGAGQPAASPDTTDRFENFWDKSLRDGIVANT